MVSYSLWRSDAWPSLAAAAAGSRYSSFSSILIVTDQPGSSFVQNGLALQIALELGAVDAKLTAHRT